MNVLLLIKYNFKVTPLVREELCFALQPFDGKTDFHIPLPNHYVNLNNICLLNSILKYNLSKLCSMNVTALDLKDPNLTTYCILTMHGYIFLSQTFLSWSKLKL